MIHSILGPLRNTIPPLKRKEETEYICPECKDYFYIEQTKPLIFWKGSIRRACISCYDILLKRHQNK